ncbi:hypothetical protein OPC74_004315 [Salmonella enterica]|nr:hypothetical protein [Salmonella enterica]
MLAGIVRGNIFHIDALMATEINQQFYKNIPELSHTEKFILSSFIKNNSAKMITKIIGRDYKTFRAIHSKIRHKFYVYNDVELSWYPGCTIDAQSRGTLSTMAA